MSIRFYSAILISLGISIAAFAHIPKASFILSKMAENSGTGYYQVEQEISFITEGEPLVLKETWFIENENGMRLSVSAQKNSKEWVAINVNYQGGYRNNGASTRITEEMFERYFHIRNPDNMSAALAQMKISPAGISNKRPLRNLKDADTDNQAEPFLRLARFGGVINFAIGVPTPGDSGSLLPGLWVEQDQFVLRKLRFPSQAEIQAEKYNLYSRGLYFPRARSLRWGDKQATIQTLSVSGRTKDQYSKFNQKPQFKLDGLSNPEQRAIVEEFYSRFR